MVHGCKITHIWITTGPVRLKYVYAYMRGCCWYNLTTPYRDFAGMYIYGHVSLGSSTVPVRI